MHWGPKTLVRIGWAGLLLLSLAPLSCQRRANAGTDGAGDTAVRVTTLQVAPTTEAVRRRFSGYCHPWEARGIGFMVAGRVASLEVDVGALVEPGALLATLQADDYALVQRLADIQAQTLQPNVVRVDNLVQQNVLPKSQLDELRGRYEAALTQRKQAARQLEYTRLVAPARGVVHERQTSVGQVIGPGMPVYILLDIERMKVKFGVTQQQLRHFTVGTDVAIDVPGVVAGRPGKIWHIAYVADPATRTYDVVVAVDNADSLLRPSMLAHLTLTTDQTTGLFLPLHAIKKNAAGEAVVLVVDPQTQTAVERPVTLGGLFEERVHVSAGLATGDAVIVQGQEFVHPGDRVKVK